MKMIPVRVIPPLAGQVLVEVGQVKHEPVADITPVEPGEGLLHLGGGQQFDVSGDAALGTEGQHLGGATAAAGTGGAQLLAAVRQVHHPQRDLADGIAEHAERAVQGGQPQQRREVVRGRDGVQDEVEPAARLFQLPGVGGDEQGRW